MAQQASTKLNLRLDIEETETAVGVGSATSRLQHLVNAALTYDNGTSANQADRVWSSSTTISTGTPLALDLRASLASVLTGDTVSFAEVCGILIRNNSTTAAQTLTIGAGSNPWITWLGATGDAVVIGPGGILLWTSPVDGAATTAATGDILTITASAASMSVDIVIWGRSA